MKKVDDMELREFVNILRVLSESEKELVLNVMNDIVDNRGKDYNVYLALNYK